MCRQQGDTVGSELAVDVSSACVSVESQMQKQLKNNLT